MVGEWPTERVGDLADSISDTHKFGKDRLIFLNTSDISLGKILRHSYSAVREWPGQAKKSIQQDDILFSEIRPANGRWAYVNVDAQDYVVSTKLMVIRSRRNRVVPRFLYHYLTSPETTQWLQHLAESRSGTFPQITFDQVAELELLLPPLKVQEQIAEFFDEIDGEIELNRRMNETLEAMARAIFKSWFVDVTESGIPKGWTAGTLSDVAENPRRTVDPSEVEPKTPYIGLEHMPRRSIALMEWGRAGDVASGKARFIKRDILFGRLRPYFHKVGVAMFDGVCSTDILTIRPKAPDWHALVLCLLSSNDLIDYADACSTGTKMPRVSWTNLARYEIALPPAELAAKFNAHVQPMLDKIIANIMESHTLAAIRDALLPKLISGELRVMRSESVVPSSIDTGQQTIGKEGAL